MARFVLVHGAWHGGWCFRRLANELVERGHEVTAPDLPCEEVGLTSVDYARVVGPQPDAIVVGHSLAGFTIAQVEAHRRVYLGARLPVEDVADSFADGFGGFVRDELGRSYWPDADTAAARMYPDCSRADSDWAFARLRRQAPVDPVLSPFGDGDIVVATLQDAVVDGDWQIRTAHAHGARVIELDAGHSPFLTQPDELADVLSSVV
jgi:pimeloyl-ACP methyl ester carboxylesterase